EELDIQHPAVAKHHGQEAELPSGGTNRDAAISAPVNLTGFPGREADGAVGFLAPRTDDPEVVTDDSDAAGVTAFLELLIDLDDGEVSLFDPPFDGRFIGLKLAVASPAFALPVGGHVHPFADRLFINARLKG